MQAHPDRPGILQSHQPAPAAPPASPAGARWIVLAQPVPSLYVEVAYPPFEDTPRCQTSYACLCCNTLQDLLSGQFNVTLGDKLSEHLKKWIDVTNVLQPPQPVSGQFSPLMAFASCCAMCD